MSTQPGVPAQPSPRPGQRYLDTCRERLDRLREQEWAQILAAAQEVAAAYSSGGVIHLFGTGHSHLLAEELYYRAGGLTRIRPILFEGLMLHVDAPLSTTLERLDGLAEALLAHHPVRAGDVLVVISNSGGNAVSSELAQGARRRGATVVAITSLLHARSDEARRTGHPRLHEIADITIDNHGTVGDAAMDVPGMGTRVGPTSTVAGAAIVNAIVVEAAAIMAEQGAPPEVYLSSNVTGGDDVNTRLLSGEPGGRSAS